jgi:hypothetical protein
LLFLQDLARWTGTLKDSTMKKEIVAFGGTLESLRRTIPTFIHLGDGLGRPKDHPSSPWRHIGGARASCSDAPAKVGNLHNVLANGEIKP